MKRMIPQSLIVWAKSMFKQIGYNDTYQATQINGELRATGSITSQGGVYADEFTGHGNKQYKLIFTPSSIILSSYNAYAVTIDVRGVTLGTSTIVKGDLSISSGKTFKIGSTTLTEAQLQKLIALIPAE